jgi:membrane protein YdbS with pleckstrin-like domain
MSETAEVPAPELAAPAPPDDAVREYALHPRVQTLWFWQALIVGAVIALPGGFAFGVAFGWLGILGQLLIAALVVVRIVTYGRRYAETFRCALLPDGLRVHRGVWWRSEVFVPRMRIQHTDVTQGPIARHYGIAKLKVFTAGTHFGEIEVEGLAHTDAVALRDELLGREGHDAL